MEGDVAWEQERTLDSGGGGFEEEALARNAWCCDDVIQVVFLWKNEKGRDKKRKSPAGNSQEIWCLALHAFTVRAWFDPWMGN